MEKNKYITWDEYFLALAKVAALRSKDPNRQVGCCITTMDNKIVSLGYNGHPKGCKNDDFPWEREGNFLKTKYPYVVHAEINAILNARGDLDNCRLYVTLFPCNDCAKAIIQSGIKEVVYQEDLYPDSDAVIASKLLFKKCGVKTRQVNPNKEFRIVI